MGATTDGFITRITAYALEVKKQLIVVDPQVKNLNKILADMKAVMNRWQELRADYNLAHPGYGGDNEIDAIPGVRDCDREYEALDARRDIIVADYRNAMTAYLKPPVKNLKDEMARFKAYMDEKEKLSALYKKSLKKGRDFYDSVKDLLGHASVLASKV